MTEDVAKVEPMRANAAHHRWSVSAQADGTTTVIEVDASTPLERTIECGDKRCNGEETCETCPGDCGACPDSCGDGACGDDEDCRRCPADCGQCDPGDGRCDATEDCVTSAGLWPMRYLRK